MSRTTGRLLALTVLLGLGACQPQPYLPTYAPAAPPPLQPYVAPPAAYAPATRHVVRRHYVRRHYVRRHVPPVNCPCIPAKPQ